MSDNFPADIDSKYDFSEAEGSSMDSGEHVEPGFREEGQGVSSEGMGTKDSTNCGTYNGQASVKSKLFEGYKDPSSQFSGQIRSYLSYSSYRSYHQDGSGVGGLTAEDIEKAREAKRNEKPHKQMVRLHVFSLVPVAQRCAVCVSCLPLCCSLSVVAQ